MAKTRAVNSPYYRVNPSGRVPYLMLDDGKGLEGSQLICAYLDHMTGSPFSISRQPDKLGMVAPRSTRAEHTRWRFCLGT